MYCIGINQREERCSETLSPSTKFCRTCIMECMPSYIRYKKAEKSLKDFSKEDVYETVLKHYVKLKTVYSLRYSFKKRFVHPSAWDRGHDSRLKCLREEIFKCEKRLIELADLSVSKANEMETEHEEREEEEIIQNSSSFFNQVELEEGKSKPKRKIITREELILKTPLDALTALVGDEAFANFLMTYLYRIFERIGRLVCEEGPYILATPILKIIHREDDRKPTCDTEALLSNITGSSHFMFYYYKLFDLFREKGYLLYRFYRTKKNCYGLTFITNYKPFVFYIIQENNIVHLGLREAPPRDFNDPFCFEENACSEWHYHRKFDREIHLVIPPGSKGKSSPALYHIYAEDLYERNKEKNYDPKNHPWKRLFENNRKKEIIRTGFIFRSVVRADNKRKIFAFD